LKIGVSTTARRRFTITAAKAAYMGGMLSDPIEMVYTALNPAAINIIVPKTIDTIHPTSNAQRLNQCV
jgi:hypothetical protein